jgi:isopenicillin N synthase-like dioxygenase
MTLLGTSPILTFDLREFDSLDPAKRAAAIDALMISLRTGFVYVASDISPDLLDKAYALLADFFALPAEVKRKYIGKQGTSTGYTGVFAERAVGESAPDLKETFQWRAELAAGHPLARRFPDRYPVTIFPDAEVSGFAAVCARLHRQLFGLQYRVLRAICVGLGASESYADDLFRDADVLNRALHYPPLASLPAGAAANWAGAHVDISLLTLLPPAKGRGLQIATEDGWVDAAPPDGYAVLNTGIMLERLSNGLIPAGRHQVVPTAGQPDRYSVVQFCHPAPWTVLAPMPSTVTAGNPARYGAITAADLLDATIWQIQSHREPDAAS